jgi:hypothetical protein
MALPIDATQKYTTMDHIDQTATDRLPLHDAVPHVVLPLPLGHSLITQQEHTPDPHPSHRTTKPKPAI